MAPSKSKKRASSTLDDNRSDDSATDEVAPAQRPAKKLRTSSSKSGDTLKDDKGDPYWELSGKRRVTLSEFKGARLISIREYYESGGKELPGKKGISLSLDQYSALLQAVPEIEKELNKKGEKVHRPEFDGESETKVANEPEENMDNGEKLEEDEEGIKKPQKANFEATSDEEEVE